MSSSFSVFLNFSNDKFRHFPIFCCKTYTKNTTFGKILSKESLKINAVFCTHCLLIRSIYYTICQCF